ncbi:MAG: DotH/IcmK family type IV secretion protein [Legionellaceae bacterium]|nr:DotH/IcmK family type IV secretion protein [Legionellaceae bacterium]
MKMMTIKNIKCPLNSTLAIFIKLLEKPSLQLLTKQFPLAAASRLTSRLVLGVFLVFTNAASAADQNSAGQALDQLRMLQKRLLSDSARANPLSAGNQNPQSTSNQQNSQTVVKDPAKERRDKAAAGSSNVTTVQPGGLDVVAPDNAKVIDELAFESVEQQLFPLNPDKIKKLRKAYNSSEYAKTLPVDTPPKPTATSQFVNLSPGSTPPVIRLSQGFVSSLVFLDSTGAPWPISAYDLGDPSAFNIQWDKTSNTLMIQSSKLYTYGNLAVRLRGLNTPVMLTLIPGQKAVDYRVDLRVQGYGPNAKSMPMEEGLPPSASDVLLHVLDGVPPPGSRRLTVSGGDARAWLLENTMFVRTNLTILSPGWIGSMTSADGMHAYEMQKSPVLLVSWHGKVMQLKVEGL